MSKMRDGIADLTGGTRPSRAETQAALDYLRRARELESWKGMRRTPSEIATCLTLPWIASRLPAPVPSERAPSKSAAAGGTTAASSPEANGASNTPIIPTRADETIQVPYGCSWTVARVLSRRTYGLRPSGRVWDRCRDPDCPCSPKPVAHYLSQRMGSKERRAEILTSIPGISDITAAGLLVLMRELDTLTGARAASLAGHWKGRSFIQGGRHRVRRLLFMPALVTVQHNPDLKRKYEALVAKGRPPKVALTAVMRKLLILANTLVQQHRIWTAYPPREYTTIFPTPCHAGSAHG